MDEKERKLDFERKIEMFKIQWINTYGKHYQKIQVEERILKTQEEVNLLWIFKIHKKKYSSLRLDTNKRPNLTIHGVSKMSEWKPPLSSSSLTVGIIHLYVWVVDISLNVWLFVHCCSKQYDIPTLYTQCCWNRSKTYEETHLIYNFLSC